MDTKVALQLNEARQNYEWHPAKSFLLIIVLGVNILLFRQSTMRIIAFDKCFYIHYVV